jgi:hypothetical protein
MSEDQKMKLDWLLSMGLMWATDIKTGLKGSVVLCYQSPAFTRIYDSLVKRQANAGEWLCYMLCTACRVWRRIFAQLYE